MDTRLLCEAGAVEPQQVRAELELRAAAGRGPDEAIGCASNPW